VGRAIGDEPLLISTLRRLAVAESCVRNLERALGQGEFQASHLEERQNDLGDEMMVPHFLIGMRGERGGTDYFLSSIENGKISLVQTLENLGKKNPTHKPGIWDPINEFFAFSTVLRTHATLLDLHTRVIEALKLPPKNRNEALKEIDLELKEIGPKDRSHLTGLLFPNTTKIGQVEQRVHSNLACAVAALAAERFRLQKNRWPKSLAELVQAGYLKKIPIDLFDGKPLRFRRTKDGLVIYSIGPDGNYDGKALDDLRNINESVVRVEFRLWDPAHRRQPPLPPPKPEQ
jgi:competence protein ComGC